ncbi:4Fe-4S dicluster domain-containing protein [bacterium]|nr:4Fe-4S dicluster domain-containing protein [bacterium]
MARLGMLIDTSKCTACRGCQVACKQWNEMPAEKTKFFSGDGYQNPADLSGKTLTLVTFKEKAAGTNMEWLFRKHQCMQCTNASCVTVCPVKAISKHADGYTMRNEKKCIGCGTCVASCPFNVPKLDDKRKVQSCRFCADRVQNGLTPACDKACLTGAICSGPRDEMLAKAKERVKVLGGKANVYGETQAGGLGVLYILLDDPVVYGLPKSPKVAQAGSLKSFTGPFGQVALVGSLMTVALNKLIQRKSQQES